MWYRHGLKWGSEMPERTGIRVGNQTAFTASTVVQPSEYAAAHGFDRFESLLVMIGDAVEHPVEVNVRQSGA